MRHFVIMICNNKNEMVQLNFFLFLFILNVYKLVIYSKETFPPTTSKKHKFVLNLIYYFEINAM